MLQTSSDAGISAFPEGDNIFNWVGTIHGADQTVRAGPPASAEDCRKTGVALPAQVYEGLKYKLTLQFPNDYPFRPPTVKARPWADRHSPQRPNCVARMCYPLHKKRARSPVCAREQFETPCFHPNVDQFGNICLGEFSQQPRSAPVPGLQPWTGQAPVKRAKKLGPLLSFPCQSDILKDKWSAVHNVRTVLLSVQSLLGGACTLQIADSSCQAAA